MSLESRADLLKEFPTLGSHINGIFAPANGYLRFGCHIDGNPEYDAIAYEISMGRVPSMREIGSSIWISILNLVGIGSFGSRQAYALLMLPFGQWSVHG